MGPISKRHHQRQMTKTRPNILFLSAYSPWPKITGGQLRSGYLAEAASRIARVRFLTLHGNISPQPPRGIEEITLRPDTTASLWPLRNADRPLAPAIPEYLMRRINRHVAEFKPDLIILEQTIIGGALESLEPGTARLILSSHNFDSDLLQGELEKRADGSLTKLGRARLDRALAQEIGIAKACDLVLSCSENDRQRYLAEGGVDSVVVPNPLSNAAAFDIEIDTERYANPDVLFVGSMRYAPNVAAATKLIRALRKPVVDRGGKIILAGRYASRLDVEGIHKNGVSLISDPPDILPVLASCGMTAMPINEGSGTRLKAIEALAAGLVVIATQKAVEGLELTPGVHYLRAESDDEFRGQYAAMHANPEECVAIASKGRAFAEERFSPEVFEASTFAALDLALKAKRKDPRKETLTAPSSNRPDLENSRSLHKPEQPCLIGTFHKTGTTLFNNILRQLEKTAGLIVWNPDRGPKPEAQWDVCFNWHSNFGAIDVWPENHPTTIVVRDPRDVVISSAYYHMKSTEGWLHVERPEFDGMTYQQKINSLVDMKSRFLFEMEHTAKDNIRAMLNRKSDPAFRDALFVRLEDLVDDVELKFFSQIFSHLSFSGSGLTAALDAAHRMSLFSGHTNKHVRDPKPAQWLSQFDDELHHAFTDRFGNAAERLGYRAAS